MVSIKTLMYTILLYSVLLVVAVVLLGLKSSEVKQLQKQITTIVAASQQLAETKQAEVNETHSRANEYLRKAKADYEKRTSNNPVNRPNRMFKSPATTLNATNTVRSFQEPAGMVETKTVDKEKSDESDCKERYLELYQTWQGLCLIYGCTD